MRHSLKENLIKYLATHRKGEWVAKGEITKMDWKYPDKRTYLADTVGRALRQAESESRIAVKDNGKSVCYKFLPTNRRSNYIPWSMRKDKSIMFKS